jgi:predicted nucleic acid-binding protein
MKDSDNEYLLDTNVCIAYINACAKQESKWNLEQRQVFEKIESIKISLTLCMSEATLGELLFGAEKSQNTAKNLKRIEIFQSVVSALPVDVEVWQLFGQIKAELQKLGKPMADMDTIIAATAKRYNLILATADADMKNLDYLKSLTITRENWIKEGIE